MVTSFNTIIHHWLTLILSSTHHTKRSDRNDRNDRSDPSATRSVVVNPQPRRVAVPSQVTDYFESKKPKQSIDLLLQENSWEEEPLTQQQQSVLRVIQQQGNSSAEGVSMQRIRITPSIAPTSNPPTCSLLFVQHTYQPQPFYKSYTIVVVRWQVSICALVVVWKWFIPFLLFKRKQF